MPQSNPSITRSSHLTLAFLSIFILAFFPGFLQFLVELPLYPLKLLALPSVLFTPPPAPSPICPAGCLPFPSDLTMSTPSSWFQKALTLPAKSRGSYLITDTIVSQLPEIKDYKVGLLNLFVQHTSCALSMNENWDSEVREDMSDALDRIAPEDKKGNLYRHNAEGPDDMPVSLPLIMLLPSNQVEKWCGNDSS
jgi:secondary thiamine-phosphate synthase enzyme